MNKSLDYVKQKARKNIETYFGAASILYIHDNIYHLHSSR